MRMFALNTVDRMIAMRVFRMIIMYFMRSVMNGVSGSFCGFLSACMGFTCLSLDALIV